MWQTLAIIFGLLALFWLCAAIRESFFEWLLKIVGFAAIVVILFFLATFASQLLGGTIHTFNHWSSNWPKHGTFPILFHYLGGFGGYLVLGGVGLGLLFLAGVRSWRWFSSGFSGK